MQYFFTADLHLGHSNIIKYTGRTLFMNDREKSLYKKIISIKPRIKKLNNTMQKQLIISKESLDKMNKEIIRRWNERVKPEDTVFVIGDFCFRNSPGGKQGEGDIIKSIDYQKQLNGNKIFIKGNHDKNNSTKTIIKRLVIGYGGKRINLVHNPEHADANYSINFTGHVHTKWQIKRIKWDWRFVDCINVGVDVWNFYPVTFNEIMKRYSQWRKKNEYKHI